MAVRAGQVMSVTFGVILAHTGFVAFALIQPHTSCSVSTTTCSVCICSTAVLERTCADSSSILESAAAAAQHCSSSEGGSLYLAVDIALRCIQCTSRRSQSCPMAMPILRSGMPCGQLKLISKASTPVASHRSISSSHAARSYSCRARQLSNSRERLHPHGCTLVPVPVD
jgi:hypothetical protein